MLPCSRSDASEDSVAPPLYCRRLIAVSALLFSLVVMSANGALAAGTARLLGNVTDPQGVYVVGAHITLVYSASVVVQEATSDEQGAFVLDVILPGQYQLKAASPAFVSIIVDVSVATDERKLINLQFKQLVSVQQAITVVASLPSALTPDPSRSVVVQDQVLDSNPGRPGAPISIPGLPIETASGGIKAPQYFAPGVAGDHGEPIAQFFQIGGFLYPNNLPANAHGNGYADPNALIPPTIESVTVDGGAFNVREGNNSVDLAATYVPSQHVGSFIQLTGDYRDVDLIGAWGSRNPRTNAWLVGEAAYGNGYLDRLEHRQQYKLNGLRRFKSGSHELTLYGLGYYGSSDLPGLIPIHVPVPGDTIDERQSDLTHTFLGVATDSWKLSEQRQFTFSGFYRNYALQLRSNFGDGLIQQSETRNVYGGETTYVQSVRPWLSVLAGVDLRRDAPRNLDLKRVDDHRIFQPVTSNDLTLSFVEPFLSLDGTMGKFVHYDVGFRQEEVWMDNADKINANNSFNRLASLTLPKVTVTFIPPDRTPLPTVAFSYGEALHTNDPRIGTGSREPQLLSPSHAYQLVFTQNIKQFEINLTLKHVWNSQELAKIDPDTGLQEDVGTSTNRVLVASVQRNFSHGAIYFSYAQADARDLNTGEPVPEAPRLILDTVGSIDRLPFGLRARGEFEYVRAKRLGDGFVGVPVYEFRGAVLRPFYRNRMSIGVNFLAASGYTGQTLETIPTQPQPCPLECVVGVPLKSYVSLSWTYYLQK